MKLLMVAAGCLVVLAACAAPPPASPLQASLDALKAGDSAAAIAGLEALTAQQPTLAEAHLLLGQAYLRANRKDDAQAALVRGFSLKPDAAFPLDAQDPEDYFAAGNALATLGQFELALKAYDTTLKLQPGRANAVTNIGVVYYQQGQLDQAIAQFKQALTIEPEDADTHYLLGAAQLQRASQSGTPGTADMTAAEQEFQTALKIKPEMAAAYIGLGNVYLLNQDFEQAAATLEQAVKLQPNSPEALFAVGQAYAALGRKPEALDALTRALQLNPPEPFRSRAQQLIQQLNTP
jgi:tetratricopeptide (TPR) repeat protein